MIQTVPKRDDFYSDYFGVPWLTNGYWNTKNNFLSTVTKHKKHQNHFLNKVASVQTSLK